VVELWEAGLRQMVQLWEVRCREDEPMLGEGKMEGPNGVERETRQEFGDSLRASCR
jgi:hypothetical protein